MDRTAEDPPPSDRAATPVLRLKRSRGAADTAPPAQAAETAPAAVTVAEGDAPPEVPASEDAAPAAAAEITAAADAAPAAEAAAVPPEVTASEGVAEAAAHSRQSRPGTPAPRWLLRALHEHYPQLFTDPRRPAGKQVWKPLALGICAPLEQAAAGWIAGGELKVPPAWQEQTLHRTLRRALRCYTRHPRYLRALCAPDSRRWDLEGRDYEVSAEHREIARQQLQAFRQRYRAQLRARRQKKRAAAAAAQTQEGASEAP